MDSIEDIYRNDVYYPFILYCQSHNYHTMLDLRKCSFEALSKADGMTAGLVLRVKSIYAAYYKKHPDLLMGNTAPKRASRAATVSPLMEEQLKGYFESHADTLIRVTDLCKELGLNRNAVSKLLEKSSWCKTVDSGTYFYSSI